MRNFLNHLTKMVQQWTQKKKKCFFYFSSEYWHCINTISRTLIDGTISASCHILWSRSTCSVNQSTGSYTPFFCVNSCFVQGLRRKGFCHLISPGCFWNTYHCIARMNSKHGVFWLSKLKKKTAKMASFCVT